MSTNRFDLHKERLATTDETGHRVFIHPENVKGKWRTRRTYFYWFLIVIYLVVPWINFKGKQIILLDIPAREFTFFGTTFFAHDAPLILLLLLGFVFTMGLITSLYGRVWCGWACPQTVFIDTIYRKIETFIEGKPRQRQKLEMSPWTLSKIFKKAFKWLIYLIVTLHITHSLLGYFVGARKLFWITLSPPTEHMTLFLFMVVITTIFLFDFGWFREQFCIIACPYGRFQSVMMDSQSLTVVYDYNRGEPRRSQTQAEAESEDETNIKEGDCISCFHCVKACPTGIDIRRGTQLECIACTNCIDACDEIMLKVQKEPGLIRFDSEDSLEGKEKKGNRVRSYIYGAAIAIVLTLFAYNINNAGKLNVTFLRGTGTPFKHTILENDVPGVLNLYRLRFDFKNQKDLLVKMELEKPLHQKMIELVTPQNPLHLIGSKSKNTILHFRFPTSLLENGSVKVNILFKNKSNQVLTQKEVTLVGPL